MWWKVLWVRMDVTLASPVKLDPAHIKQLFCLFDSSWLFKQFSQEKKWSWHQAVNQGVVSLNPDTFRQLTCDPWLPQQQKTPCCWDLFTFVEFNLKKDDLRTMIFFFLFCSFLFLLFLTFIYKVSFFIILYLYCA